MKKHTRSGKKKTPRKRKINLDARKWRVPVVPNKKGKMIIEQKYLKQRKIQ